MLLFIRHNKKGRAKMARFLYSAFSDEAADSIDGQIAACKANGVTHMELRGVDGKNISEFTVDEAKALKEKLDANGMKVSSIGSYYGKIEITDDFEPHFEGFKNTVEVAKILEAKYIRLFSFYCPSGKQELYSEEVMKRLECFISAAKGTGLILCHENEKGIYGDNALRCEEIHRNFPELKAVFDPANFVQCGEDTIAAWKLLSPYVEYMHIKDALSDGTVVPAGKGNGNLPYLLSQYSGSVLTIEPHLSVFDGFSSLESGNSSKNESFCYPNSRAAFDAAAYALRTLL